MLFEKSQLFTVNLGTGKGYSVLEIVKAFEKASGKIIPYQIVGRRSGDVDACYADTSYATKKLDWKAQYGLDDMCKDLGIGNYLIRMVMNSIILLLFSFSCIIYIK